MLTLLTVGTFIGLFKGTEAKQKWMFKIKNREQSKRMLADQKKEQRNGAVPLDEIELAAYHRI